MSLDENQEDGGKKKSGLMGLVIPLVVLTLVGGGGGWVIGGMLSPRVQQAADVAKAAEEAAAGAEGKDGKKAEEGLPTISTEANGVVALEPITTNLAYPSENWVRLEVAILFNGPPDVKVAEDVHQDIMAYLRTVSLQQIEGPRGFQYLKDDIEERVDLRSEGRVSKVMFRTFVIE
ncbi:flagellar basal body-associated FliL family protein [Peteryoungia ipomoeae]|uniref:Flagellar protein FliL n=1 Tax=Peteryoungia ipomoeae TaxID=1210932 RepID=A0A4S8P122_9HYPH|nr:flagellar basal body-associated FliL family protein [Peteryoungia ipomoeae]THV23703.1 flagellar basal body-associated FliL family protein [Peteryoungia ipomoeae]